MTSRERVRRALQHQPTDRPPIDMGATPVTGIAASTYSQLRAALGLNGGPVRVHDPFQILADVYDDVRRLLGIDTVGLWSPATLFGFRNTGRWKPWTLQDGTPVLVSEQFEYTTDANGDVLAYPAGDRMDKPSGRLPKGGYYFDAIVRQGPLDDDHLDPQDWAEQFGVYTDEDLGYFQRTVDHLYRETDLAIIGVCGQGGFGDVALVPGQMLRCPKGLRDPNLWYEYLLTNPEYIRGIFEIHANVALRNLELYRQAVGNKIDVLFMSGTDFGTQRSLIASPEVFRTIWKPFYKLVNDWVHKHTSWKTFFHSCGAIEPLIEDFIEIGVDILNPVQCSATGMDPQTLKRKYGERIVFWGGGIDTQHTLPFGTPDEVRQQVRERIDVFGQNGGFVFNTIHNIQHGTPPRNIIAMFETVLGREIRSHGSAALAAG